MTRRADSVAAGRRAELGPRMRAARTERGLALRDLADQVGMSSSSLSEFEHGKSIPGAARLEALASILEIHLYDDSVEDEPARFTHWRTFEPVELSEVLRAAEEVFLERGFEGATIRAIAERCQLSVAAIYHHSGGKGDLLAELLRMAMRELDGRTRAAAAEPATPQQRLTHLVECLVGFSVHRRSWAVLASSEVRSFDAELTAEHSAVHGRVHALVAGAYAECRGGTTGEVPDVVAARAIVTMCASIANWYLAAGSPEPEALARQYAALAVSMIPDRTA